VTEGVAVRRSWREAFADYRDRRAVAMLLLGFSSGLPLLLVFATFSRWLSESGLSVKDIGLLSLVGLAYGLKFLWAPLVDQLRLPLLHARLGRRRSWLLLAQFGVAIGLVGMALSEPRSDVWTAAAFAVIVAFSGATQDIAIDAWRIESAPQELQGALAGAYQLGYRVALFTAGAGTLFLVASLEAELGPAASAAQGSALGWRIGYFVMAAFMAIGIATTLWIAEPAAPREALVRARGLAMRLAAWGTNAIVNPFVEFFTRTGWLSLVILAFIGCYWLSDRVWGVMAQPFYHNMGFTKTEVAFASGTFGVIMSGVGVIVGGSIISRFGVMWPLLVCAILTALTNLLFAGLALHGKSMAFLMAVIAAENMVGGMAGTALIAYLSGLTNTAYTATQYALFSSLMALPGKMVAASSGFIVEAIGYPLFFVYTAAMGVPAVLLLLVLIAHRTRFAAPLPDAAAPAR
jgi:PAT family beta-lactamase induction signal transducer AmpG